VFVDDVAGGEIAVRHLLDIGRRRIAFVGGSLVIRQVSDRLTGARAAVAEHAGASLEVVETAALTVDEGAKAARALLTRPPADRPDAVFAANDVLAIGMLQVLAGSGDVTIPGDIALIGYDDIDFASAAIVPLSSIRQPAALIGATAVELLLTRTGEAAVVGRASEPTRAVRFQPELVARASTGAR
jgi:LacI family transcriptional regulator